MPTRTGSYPIGFRRGWSDWQKRDLGELLAWGAQAGFEMIDLGVVSDADLSTLAGTGLKLGTADLSFGALMAIDPGERRDAAARNADYVRTAAGQGVKVFFTCVIPKDLSKKRSENFAIAVESFGPVIEAAHRAGAWVAIEGYPGGGPHYPSLCCSPETMRAFLKEFNHQGVGINYDPSHLIRLRVDHIRFLNEFVGSVKHVHGKDTELNDEALYEYGTQPGTFTPATGFGEWTWRYTIPGHGVARWSTIFEILQKAGYQGGVSVELEDAHFNGSEAGEKTGLLHSLAFLRSA